MKKTALLFLTILIEGYIVLACELLAIRNLVPFTGSGVEIVAIVIGGVLMPLAIGYHRGGTAWRRRAAQSIRNGKKILSIRQILLRNLVGAMFFLTFGLSYLAMEDFFNLLTGLGLRERLVQTGAYTLLFLVTPIYLLGQTVPLVSHYFTRHRLHEITGKMLFFSTSGAFLGSIFTTLVLMMTIGVHHTVIVTLGLLSILCLLLKGRKQRLLIAAVLVLFLITVLLNAGGYWRHIGFVSDNAYNTARIVNLPDEDASILLLNRSPASKISRDPENRPPYEKYIEKNFIDTILNGGKQRDILMIGAGGFTIGIDDVFNHYTIVDIDPNLKNVAEQDFQQHPLPPNKHFEAASARAFLHADTKTYDLIIIDVFQNTYAIAPEVTTQEFLLSAQKRLKENGVLLANIYASPDFRDDFSVRYDRTFSSVFPVHNRDIVGTMEPWHVSDNDDPARYLTNIIYSYFNTARVRDTQIYTDDHNTYSIDRP